MSTIQPKTLRTKSGALVTVRSAEKRDAAGLLKLAQDVIGEEIYQLTTSAEFKMTLEEEEKWIESVAAKPNHLILVAELGGRIVGILDSANGHRQRIAHNAEFGMSVAADLRSQGIGAHLLTALIEWGAAHPLIEKINLMVHGTNARAIALYRKMGFEIEGTRKRDLKYGPGEYVDTVLMGRFVK